ncbi:MAG: hypothetical protein A2W80_10530 [Candidatus Riflebacteria bacterium GWC2_50_8]|nr:MAG: hypothetical protein A2W80_10530 [Candidatus Riflebacteria bacterium GWC2_50_8]
MTNSFEFLPADRRKIRMPKVSLLLFLTTAIVFVISTVSLHKYSSNLEKAYQDASTRVENEAISFIKRALQLMPDPSSVDDIAVKTTRHNLEMGELTSVWTKLFNTLDAVLPEDSAIQLIENPQTGKMMFSAADRHFRIRVALSGTEAANDIYARLAALQAIESLSFTPRSEMKNTVTKGLSVDLEFRFNEAYATTP